MRQSRVRFEYGAFTLFDGPSQTLPLRTRFLTLRTVCSPFFACPATPSTHPLQGFPRIRFRLFRFRSPLLTESLLFSLPRGTEMFQFSRLPLQTYAFSLQSWPITTRGFPHSDIHGSMLAYSSPWHFGVRPVLLRLLAPRHPPCALSTFTNFNTLPPSRYISVSLEVCVLNSFTITFIHIPANEVQLPICFFVNRKIQFSLSGCQGTRLYVRRHKGEGCFHLYSYRQGPFKTKHTPTHDFLPWTASLLLVPPSRTQRYAPFVTQIVPTPERELTRRFRDACGSTDSAGLPLSP